MTCNSSLFTTFQSHLSISIVTLVDGSSSSVLRSRTIHLTPLITLTSILSLPQYSFKLISVSKPTHTLNYSISFFPGYCLIQDISTNLIIGRGRKSGVLYILDTKVPKFVTCFGVITSFKLHCRICHPSLSIKEAISSFF